MPLILGTNSIKDTGYDVANSLRFDGASNDYLNRSFSSGTGTTFTVSAWIKRSNLNQSVVLLSSGANSSNDLDEIVIQTDGSFRAFSYTSGYTFHLTSNALFRDVSAWYHFMFVYDSTNSTSGDRARMYVNGSEITSFSAEVQPSQSTVSNYFNKNREHYISGNLGSTDTGTHYIAEYCFIDGQALTPTSFGEFDSDSGIWKPIDVSGLTFGTNGFYLDFEDSSALGNDAAGSNNFTVNNLTAIDQSTDTCTNNFCTLNPLIPDGSVTLAEGNLKVSSIGDNDWRAGTFGGAFKWYAECKINVAYDGSGGGICIGAISEDGLTENNGGSFGMSLSNAKWYTNSNDGKFQEGNGTNVTTGLTRASTNDIVGVACDSANGRIYIHVNGTYLNSGDPTGGSGFIGGTTAYQGVWLPFIGSHSDKGQGTWNFGSPAFAISSGNTDGNGYGNFEYSVPSGYYSLCSKNLAEYG